MKRAFFSILLLTVFTMSCVTTKKIEQSELVITRVDILPDTSYNAQLNFDGKNYGKIKNTETKTFRIPNGYHAISAVKAHMGSGSFSFEISNERIEITMDYSFLTPKFHIRNKIVLSNPQVSIPLLNEAINSSFVTLNSLIPKGSRIAIINITPLNNDTSFIQEELMVLFANSRNSTVVDRQTLDTIRSEQRFQMSGEVSDETAVAIGHFLGADVIVTGSIASDTSQKRLRLRAISVKTAEIIAMSSVEI